MLNDDKNKFKYKNLDWFIKDFMVKNFRFLILLLLISKNLRLLFTKVIN